MGSLHAAGGTVVAVVSAGIGLIAAIAALRGGSGWIDRLRVGLLGLIGLQILAGLIVLAMGSRPAEGLHFLYALAAFAILPLAGTFGAEAPARPRAWILVAACALLTLLAWRLASTG